MSNTNTESAGERLRHELSGCCAMGLCGSGRAEAVRLMNRAKKAKEDGRANEAADLVRAAIAKAETR